MQKMLLSLSLQEKFKVARHKKPLPLIESAEVQDIGAEGKSIARVAGKVIFLTHAVPGDIVDIQIIRKRKNYLEGIPVRFLKYSADRSTPFCEHFGVCGGCKWQNLPYEKQLQYKQKQVVDQLTRIAKLEKDSLDQLKPILPSSQTQFYRNKLEYTFSNKRWLTKEELESDKTFNNRKALGFHLPGRFDKILDVNHCYLQQNPSDEIRNWFRKYTESDIYEYFDLRDHSGFLRNLVIRTSSSGEIMVILSFYEDNKSLREDLLGALIKDFPAITSLMFVINKKANDTILDQDIHLFYGKDHLIEKMENLEFKVGPKSFFQTNSLQALNLYKLVRSMADLHGTEIVYDLYSGTGTIACFIASKAGMVVGLESVPEAAEDARENARRNYISNAYFEAGDIKETLTTSLIHKYGNPDVIILDPPRTGMHAKVVQEILALKPEIIVYVSCNPATQARDIALLSNLYAVRRIQPVDMFPHTHHVENVVKLELIPA